MYWNGSFNGAVLLCAKSKKEEGSNWSGVTHISLSGAQGQAHIEITVERY